MERRLDSWERPVLGNRQVWTQQGLEAGLSGSRRAHTLPAQGQCLLRRARAACMESPWQLSPASKAAVRDPSCQTVSGNIPVTWVAVWVACIPGPESHDPACQPGSPSLLPLAQYQRSPSKTTPCSLALAEAKGTTHPPQGQREIQRRNPSGPTPAGAPEAPSQGLESWSVRGRPSTRGGHFWKPSRQEGPPWEPQPLPKPTGHSWQVRLPHRVLGGLLWLLLTLNIPWG